MFQLVNVIKTGYTNHKIKRKKEIPMNPVKLLQLKAAWERFKNNHPKFPKFLSTVYRNHLKEGTLIEFKVTSPDGEEISANLRIKEDDMALMQELSSLFQ